MKQVTRYQCSYCRRLFAKPETAERHEKECVSNPCGVNCFLCEHCQYDDWHDDWGNLSQNHPICDYNEESLYTLKNCAGEHKSYAPLCSDFVRQKTASDQEPLCPELLNKRYSGLIEED